MLLISSVSVNTLRHASRGFANSGEKKDPLHRAGNTWSFAWATASAIAGSCLRSSSVNCSGPRLKLIVCLGEGFMQLFALLFRQPLRSEIKGEFIDLAGELERNIVAIFQHRDACARVLADVEGFVLRECDRGRVLHGILGHFLTVHIEHPRPSLAQARTIGLEV